jgi:hypothetical protein
VTVYPEAQHLRVDWHEKLAAAMMPLEGRNA